MIKHRSKVTKWLYIQSFIYTKLYIQSYIPKLYIQRIKQEFNLSVGSHISITLQCELCSWQLGGLRVGGGMGALSPPPILLHINIWLCIFICTILLYILFFKTINFFPKFNFLASYSSLFLKSNLAIFWA